MTSDSITEQAARAAYIADNEGNEEFAARSWDESVREPNATKDYWRRIALAALAHQAPATEDEAAEVEWAVRERDGIVDDGFGGVRERAESFAYRHDLTLVSRTVTPWREAQA